MSEKIMKNEASGRKEGGDTQTVQKDTVALELSSVAIPILIAEEQMRTFDRIAKSLEEIAVILQEMRE